jgi:RNA polymerase sigma-70 factor (ECF subfamily)
MRHSDGEHLAREIGESAAALVLYARQWLDAATAEDVVQNALVALLSQRRAPHNLRAWMYRAVRNGAIDSGRATSRRRRREQSVAQTRRGWFLPHLDAVLDAQIAEESLRKLSPDLREVVLLRIWSDLTYSEIAEIMQLSVSTVHDRYKAALCELRAALERPCPTNKS